MTIKRFEDLDVWKMSRSCYQKLIYLIRETELKNNYPLRNQMERSFGSVMDNIAEGFERSGTREFIQFLSIAKGSCGEARSQLYRVLDNGYMNELDYNNLNKELELTSGKINNLMAYLKSSNKGWKFKTE